MEPLSVRLDNFTSYESESVNFENVHIAALVGPNGSGKSSLVESIAFCLYGQGPKGGVRSCDNFVRTGEDSCSVSMEMLLGENKYRVDRSWNLRISKTSLDLYIWQGDRWEPISGNTIGETQGKIESLIKMDYRSFVSSVFAVQGESDSFTSDKMKDSERKEVFAAILGLDIWDRLEDFAKDELKGLKSKKETLDSKLRQFREHIEKEEDLTSKKESIEAKLKFVNSSIDTAQNEIDSFQKDIIRLGLKENEIESLKKQREESIEHFDSQLSAFAKEEANTVNEINKIRRLLDEERGQLEVLDEILLNKHDITGAYNKHKELSGILTDIREKSLRHSKLSSELEKLKIQSVEWESKIEIEYNKHANDLKRAEHDAMLLEEVPCRDDLQGECKLLSSAKRAACEVKEIKKKLSGISSHMNPYEGKISRLEVKIAEIGYDPKLHENLENELDALASLARKKGELDAAEMRKEYCNSLINEYAERLDDLEIKMREIEIEVHSTNGEREEKLLRFDSEIAGIKESLLSFEESRQRLFVEKANLKDLTLESNNLRERLGSVNQELSNIRSLKEDEKKADEEIRVIQKEIDIYSLVERASSKKSGVPTYIMENSIPEIESTANLLLERIVGGRFSIRIDTQLGTKTTDTMREVFKVSIFDCGKARPYQTFSGGERFVVDFALRVAISKFLACRAGTEVRLLVIDEELSALDDINRQMVLDAIFEIAKDFRKVFVVTHITELQDEFGEKLYFTKDEEGSHVKVVA